MEIFGIAITFFSALLAFLAWNNGRWMKESEKRQTEMINKQTEILNKHGEMLNKQTEMLNKQTEMLNKQTEMLLEIKNVIVEEAKSAREILKKMEENAEIRHREVIEILSHIK